MKRLILLRHAKSSWESDAVNDHSRPLNDRGRAEAPLLGARLSERECLPDLVLCSDAVRARQTWDLAASTLDPKPDLVVDRRLYLAGPHQVREVVGAQGDDVETLLLVGHNPGWENATEWLSGEEAVLKTATAVLLRARREAPWADLVEAPCDFELVDRFRAVES